MSPTREECIANAARIYEGILADPVRAAEIRAHMAQYDATQTADERPDRKEAPTE